MMKPGKIQEDKNAKFISVCDCGTIHTSPLSDYALMSRTNKPIFIICGNCDNISVQFVDKQGNRVMTNCIQEFDTVGRACSRVSSYEAVNFQPVFKDACKVYWSKGYTEDR